MKIVGCVYMAENFMDISATLQGARVAYHRPPRAHYLAGDMEAPMD